MLKLKPTKHEIYQTRRIAREIYTDKSIAPKMRRAEVKKRLKQMDGYDSILATIALQIAVKIAIALILKWVESKFTSPPEGYQSDEPGFPG